MAKTEDRDGVDDGPDDGGPSIEALYDIVSQVQRKLPQDIAALARDVVVQIENAPPGDVLSDMGIGNRLALTGLYDGIPLTEKSASDQPLMPDIIYLFRAPIVDEWRGRGDIPLRKLVVHVYIHELAHHFGWSDDDIAEIDRWWE